MNPVKMGSFQRSWLLLVFDSLLFFFLTEWASALPADELTNGNKVYFPLFLLIGFNCSDQGWASEIMPISVISGATIEKPDQ